MTATIEEKRNEANKLYDTLSLEEVRELFTKEFADCPSIIAQANNINKITMTVLLADLIK